MMCLIVDINIAHKVFFLTKDGMFLDLYNEIFSKSKSKIKLTYGGKLLNEYQKDHKIMRILAILDRAGRAKSVSNHDVDNEERIVRKLKTCISNDEHIIALARASGARLLCTADNKLKTDFKNKKLIDRPQGRLYCSRSHTKLVNDNCR